MLRSILITLLVAFSASVGAQGIDYDYMQGSYGRVDLDSVALDVDGDGFGLSASFSIDENFHVFGEYQTADLNFGADLDLLELGVGYHAVGKKMTGPQENCARHAGSPNVEGAQMSRLRTSSVPAQALIEPQSTSLKSRLSRSEVSFLE